MNSSCQAISSSDAKLSVHGTNSPRTFNSRPRLKCLPCKAADGHECVHPIQATDGSKSLSVI